MDAKLAKIYYSPQGYWKGVSAIKKLAEAAKVPENVSKQWLYKQALWQIYLPAPRHVPRPKFDVATPNSVHQADLLFYLMTSFLEGKKNLQICVDCCRHRQPLQRSGAFDLKKL